MLRLKHMSKHIVTLSFLFALCAGGCDWFGSSTDDAGVTSSCERDPDCPSDMVCHLELCIFGARDAGAVDTGFVDGSRSDANASDQHSALPDRADAAGPDTTQPDASQPDANQPDAHFVACAENELYHDVTDSCPTGLSCQLNALNSPQCLPDRGGGSAFYMGCATDDDCPKGSICHNTLGWLTCEALCTTNHPCPIDPVRSTSPQCLFVYASDYLLCARDWPCNEFNGADCPPGTACYLMLSFDYHVCRYPGTVPEDGSCQAAYECVPGLQCAANICARYCVDNGDCRGEQSCTEYDGVWVCM